MSSQDLSNAIKSINDSASRANATTDFFNRVLDGGKYESVRNPITGVIVPSVQKSVYDQYKDDESQIHQDVVESKAAADRAEVAADHVDDVYDSFANSVWNRRIVYAAANSSFANYQDEGRTLTPRLSFEGYHYLPMFDSSVQVNFTSLPIKNGDGTISVQTDKGVRNFSRVFAEAVSRHEIDTPQYIRLNIAEAKAKTDWVEGQSCFIAEYGCEFKFINTRRLVPASDELVVTFDDEVHILVNSGGMLQFSDFGILSSIHSINKSKVVSAVKDTTTEISVDVYGDSETFGQALPDTHNATNMIGVPTGFGDGSTHEHWQYNAHYPQWLWSMLVDNYANPTKVNNFGYSGDRVQSGYLRHRIKTGSKIAVLAYGINDCLFSSSNGTDPSGIGNGAYSVESYTRALSLFVAKQILQGKEVVLLGSVVFASLSGYDQSQFSASRLARAFNGASKNVADAYGCKWIDTANDILNQYSMTEITQEGTHLNVEGHRIVGVRLASALMQNEMVQKVSGGSVVIANPSTGVIASKNKNNILPNSTSSTPWGFTSNDPTTIPVGNEWISVPFYASSDNLVAYFNGLSNSAGVNYEIRLDDGCLQSDLHFQYSFLQRKPVSTKSGTINTWFTREITNFSDPDGLFLIIPNKGWHVLSIKKTGGSGSLLFDSVMFESLSNVLASDKFGATAKLVMDSSGSPASLSYNADESYNIGSASVLSAGTIRVSFRNGMANNNYQVSIDAVCGGGGVISAVTQKDRAGFTIQVLYGDGSGGGMSFNPTNPSHLVVSVIGGK